MLTITKYCLKTKVVPIGINASSETAKILLHTEEWYLCRLGHNSHATREHWKMSWGHFWQAQAVSLPNQSDACATVLHSMWLTSTLPPQEMCNLSKRYNITTHANNVRSAMAD